MKSIYLSLPVLLLSVACAEMAPADDSVSLAAELSDAEAILAAVNDPSVTVAMLDDDAGLDRRAATGIVARRPFDSLDELDAVPFVGARALDKLLVFAREHLGDDGGGGGGEVGDTTFEVIFSPQPKSLSHNTRIAELIDEAVSSVDIAIYSFSSSQVLDALEDAIDRGVRVRVIFETARDDVKLDEEELLLSKSARFENRGADVRFVNKIMHHKFAIIDGPRDDLESAETAVVASGSANMSHGGASIYDENTLILSGHAELALRYQKEFNLLWDHSRDVVIEEFDFDASAIEIAESDIPDDPDFLLHLTSDNFSVKEGGTTFKTNRKSMVGADAWVEAIESAEHQILIASGHLRLRPVAEALIAKRAENPDIDIRVYLDQQEFISHSGNRRQKEKLESCLAGASSQTAEFNCLNKSFLWAREVGDAGIDVRYKSYALRWHFSYAVQMHHKFMIVDGERLLTGSYNLSINAEHSTFENIMEFRGEAYGAIIEEYMNEFEELWDTGAGKLKSLRARIKTADPVPLVFDSMALTESEVTSLRSLIRKNCKQADSEAFRKFPEKHKVCPRL